MSIWEGVNNLDSRFPTLTGLEFAAETVRCNISKFAFRSNKKVAGRKYQNELFEKLISLTVKVHSVDNEPRSGSLSERQATREMVNEMREDSQGHYNSTIQLFDVLSRYCICHEIHRPINAWLRLKVDKLGPDVAPIFNILFLSHPHDSKPVAPQTWTSTKIYVCSR